MEASPVSSMVLDFEYMFVCDLIMLPITASALAYLVFYAVKTGCLRFYIRLLLALLILVFSYATNFVSFLQIAPNHRQILRPFWWSFWYEAGVYAWQLRSVTTFLFCWQQFDSVASISSPQKSKIRQVMSTSLVVAMFATYFLMCFYIGKCVLFYLAQKTESL
jgi:hypothetical protein